ncbi:MAG TPA: GTPase HflX [Chloroflexi bacterium]|jgi:GTP-binding protein HflX|nr:GTPase HflX [Chloroflexota bacterium]
MMDRMERLRRRQKAFLVGAQVRGEDNLFALEDSLDELERLAHTAGLEVVGREQQRLNAIEPGTYIGTGKVKEIKGLAEALGFDVVIFDDELSPAQLRNLERDLGVEILDRTALILDIFALHARTREGALQVELAQYIYRLPRLTRQWTHLSRQTVGGVGLRGPGETQLESDRRDIRRRMSQLRAELEQVRQQRGQQRRRRRRSGLPVIGIVGYTNAGKSTLINRLSGADVLVEDMLFATLDPTTRRVALSGGKEVLFTDTVGFIQKLPTQLVAAFRATLEEVQEADMLLHVVDASDHNVLEKVDAVEDVLDEIGAGDKPVVLALNKIDLIDPETELQSGAGPLAMKREPLTELQARYDHVIMVSAEQGVGIDDLLGEIEVMLAEQMVEIDAVLPYNAGDVLDLWHTQGVIEVEEYDEAGVHIRGRLPRWAASTVQEIQRQP